MSRILIAIIGLAVAAVAVLLGVAADSTESVDLAPGELVSRVLGENELGKQLRPINVVAVRESSGFDLTLKTWGEFALDNGGANFEKQLGEFLEQQHKAERWKKLQRITPDSPHQVPAPRNANWWNKSDVSKGHGYRVSRMGGQCDVIVSEDKRRVWIHTRNG